MKNYELYSYDIAVNLNKKFAGSFKYFWSAETWALALRHLEAGHIYGIYDLRHKKFIKFIL